MGLCRHGNGSPLATAAIAYDASQIAGCAFLPGKPLGHSFERRPDTAGIDLMARQALVVLGKFQAGGCIGKSTGSQKARQDRRGGETNKMHGIVSKN